VQWTKAACPDWYPGICLVGDIDANGKSDLIRIGQLSRGIPDVMRDIGSSMPDWELAWHKDICGKSRRCAIGDVNGDSRADVVSFGKDGSVEVANSIAN
jgi:hypothetical protein